MISSQNSSQPEWAILALLGVYDLVCILYCLHCRTSVRMSRDYRRCSRKLQSIELFFAPVCWVDCDLELSFLGDRHTIDFAYDLSTFVKE